ncbi:hypothetical protein GH975_01455 [Litorivicinus lipolyticus]|uniref:TIGR02449 family protein n=1 Tax=Litorivicinus lipolyticus TaxID=418701 RepID=A0A5Q2Q5K8_9GAMM|nr:hypothetical protein [Litorivicinus lipolyticus]QGG79299.1 hypothetical protein GH975_01455 [Litorivicinus lipolyticus]
MDHSPISKLESQVESLAELCDTLIRDNKALRLEREQLRTKVARLAVKQEKARDRLNQIGERIKAMESSA